MPRRLRRCRWRRLAGWVTTQREVERIFRSAGKRRAGVRPKCQWALVNVAGTTVGWLRASTAWQACEMRLRLANRQLSMRPRSGMNCPQTVKASFMHASRSSCAPAIAAIGVKSQTKQAERKRCDLHSPLLLRRRLRRAEPGPLLVRITYRTAIAAALTPGLGFILHLSEIDRLLFARIAAEAFVRLQSELARMSASIAWCPGAARGSCAFVFRRGPDGYRDMDASTNGALGMTAGNAVVSQP